MSSGIGWSDSEMGMPEYEKLRNKALRVYRREPPKPPKSRTLTVAAAIWFFLNTSFGIWVMTATFGSMAALSYSNLQQCLKDADASIVRQRNNEIEIRNREALINEAIIHTKTVDELRSRLREIPPTRPEYKDATIEFLESEQTTIRGQTSHPKAYVDALIDRMMNSKLNNEALKFSQAFAGHIAGDLVDADLPKLKELVPTPEEVTDDFRFARKWTLVPACSVFNSVRSLWTSRGRILELKPADEGSGLS